MDAPEAGALLPRAPDDVTQALVAYVVSLVALSLVFVGLRLYIRAFIIRKFGLDDWALVLTAVALLFCVVGIVVLTKFGFGRHMQDISLSDLTIILALMWFLSLGYHFTLMILKCAFLLQFRRAFPLPTFQRLCDIFLVFIGCWTVAGAIAGCTVCLPVADQWKPASLDPDNVCKAKLTAWLAHGIIHIVTDVLIFIMPLPLIRTLPLTKPQKWTLIGVFCLGFFTCAISAIRLTTLRNAVLGPDTTWYMSRTVFWSMGEATCAILCLCIPTLRPLLSIQKTRRFWRNYAGGDAIELREESQPRAGSVYTEDRRIDDSHIDHGLPGHTRQST